MVRATGASQSVPTPQTQLPARVVVRVAVGAPEPALAARTAPGAVSAPRKATTVIAPTHEPDACVAVMVALVSGAGATACQISAVPAWALARWRKVQVR